MFSVNNAALSSNLPFYSSYHEQVSELMRSNAKLKDALARTGDKVSSHKLVGHHFATCCNLKLPNIPQAQMSAHINVFSAHHKFSMLAIVSVVQGSRLAVLSPQ